jgi:O-antigen/teichoic acid export membrane protein
MSIMLSEKYKNLINQSVLYGLGIFLMKGISLIMLPVYTHYLSPADYGRLEVLVVSANIFSIILSFGLVEALCRFVGLTKEPDDKKRHAGECLFLAIIIAVISYTFFHLYSAVVVNFLPGEITEKEMYSLGIALAVGGMINVPLAWLRITDNAFLFFKITMLKVILQVGLTVYWLSSGMGVLSVLAAGAVSSVVIALLLSFIQIKETGLNLSLVSLIAILKYAGPILIGGLATFALSGMDRWILAEYFGAEEIAAYAIAIKFALVPTLLIQPFTLWWFPKRYSVLNEKNGKELNAHFSILGSILAILLCGGVGLVGPYLIQELTPEEYHSAIQILPWLLLCTLIKMVSELLNLGCFIDKNSQLQMNINFISCGIGALLLFVLIPQFMIVGALVSLLTANLTRLALFYCYSQKQLYLPYKFGYLYTAFGATIVAMWLGQIIEKSSWLASS